MRTDIFLVFNILPIILLLSTSIFIFAVRGAKRPTIFIIASRLISLALLLFNLFQHYNTPVYGRILLNHVNLLLLLATYPLYFAYAFSLMRPKSVNRKFWMLTYLPLAVLCLAFVACRVYDGPMTPLISYDMVLENLHRPELWICLAGALFFFVQVCVFGALASKMQRQYVRNLKLEFSYTEGISLKWMQLGVVLILIDSIFSLLLLSVEGRVIKIVSLIYFTLLLLTTTIVVLRQKNVYRQSTRRNEEDAEVQSKTIAEELEVGAQKNSSVRQQRLKKKLLYLLTQEEIFKNSELSAEMVCDLLQTNRTYLSKLIKEEFNANFYGLINQYRYQKALDLMSSQDFSLKYTMRYIAELSGFKSPSVFYSYFKEQAGCTPSEWLENHEGAMDAPSEPST